MSAWTASYKLTLKTAAIATGIASGTMIDAASDFARWRAVHGVADYYSVTFEPVDETVEVSR